MNNSEYLALENPGVIAEFFDRKLSTWVEKLKWPILIFNFALFGFNIYLVSGLETSVNRPSILKDSNPIQKLSDWYNYELWKLDMVTVDLNFGIKPKLWMDPSVSVWAQNPSGRIQLDTNFNPALRDNQYRLLSICDEIALKPELIQLDCPIYNFRNYLRDVHKIRFPVPEKEFHYWMGRWFFEQLSFHDITKKGGFIDGNLIFH